MFIKQDDFVCTGKNVIINSHDNELAKKAKDMGFSVWVQGNCTEDISACILDGFAGRVSLEQGNICAATCKAFKKMLNDISISLEFIDGFILPVPKLSGLLWSDDFENAIHDSGDIFDIFDEYVTESPVRQRYFEMLEDYIISKYIEPVHSFAKKIGKRISFDMGSGEIQYDFMPVLNPIRMISQGLSLTFEKHTAEIDAMCNLPDNCKDAERVLLIKPVRGCRRKYVYTGEKRRARVETPALCTSFEGTFYCERLTQHGINFTAVDEYWFENSAYVKEGKINLNSAEYKEIILCNGCFFSEKGKNILAEAKKCGVLINPGEILQKLMEEV